MSYQGREIKNLKISKDVHDILKSYCDKQGVKIYRFLEKLILEKCKEKKDSGALSVIRFKIENKKIKFNQLTHIKCLEIQSLYYKKVLVDFKNYKLITKSKYSGSKD